MILACPHCGIKLTEQLINGISCCVKCNRVIDNSLSNRLLSASWLMRHNNYHSIEQLISDTKLAEPEAIFVYSFAGDNSYSHDEFQKVLKLFGITKS